MSDPIKNPMNNYSREDKIIILGTVALFIFLLWLGDYMWGRGFW